jgi:sialic acid synthase SpsE
MFDAFDHCKKMGIIPLCTPWDLASVVAFEEYGMPAYKTSSADLTNHELVSAVAQTYWPILVSTGMSMESEVEETVAILRDIRADYVLLHSNATYPTPFKGVNLNYPQHLIKLGDGLVWYSGHERGIHVPLAAVALGARVIESTSPPTEIWKEMPPRSACSQPNSR